MYHSWQTISAIVLLGSNIRAGYTTVSVQRQWRQNKLYGSPYQVRANRTYQTVLHRIKGKIKGGREHVEYSGTCLPNLCPTVLLFHRGNDPRACGNSSTTECRNTKTYGRTSIICSGTQNNTESHISKTGVRACTNILRPDRTTINHNDLASMVHVLPQNPLSPPWDEYVKSQDIGNSKMRIEQATPLHTCHQMHLFLQVSYASTEVCPGTGWIDHRLSRILRTPSIQTSTTPKHHLDRPH